MFDVFYVFWTHSDEYIELYEESQDGVRDKDVIDVNDDEEDTLEIAKYIFNIKILSFSMQSVKTTFNLKLLYKLSSRLKVYLCHCKLKWFDPRNRNCYLWDQMLSSNPISSPCEELYGPLCYIIFKFSGAISNPYFVTTLQSRT